MSPAAASPTVWIIAGESSGDLYGARLARELRQLVPGLVIKGMGGLAMRQEGVDILVDSTELGVVGFAEVVRHLPRFWGVFQGLVRRALAERPGTVVLIDYPGFNLRFARHLWRAGIPVVYYISPQVWAWGQDRIPAIARMISKMLVIFPFEPAVYAGTGLDVEFVGHPLVGILEEQRLASERASNALLLLPGSRSSEVNRLLPIMLETTAWFAARHPEFRYVLATPRQAVADRVGRICDSWRAARDNAPQVEIVVGRTAEWLQRATLGLAASGTVTVEAAILGLPLVVTYRLNWLTFQAARRRVKVRFITMVNLIAGRLVFEELIQDEARPERLGPALEAILPSGPRRAEVERGMAEAVAKLGAPGQASRRAALAVAACLGAPAPAGNASPHTNPP